MVRLRVDSSCFCHLGFQYAIALVSCTCRVVPNNTTQYDFKKKKNNHSVDRTRFTTAIYLAKSFQHHTSCQAISHWLKTPLSPLRSSLRGKNFDTRPSEMPPKGKKTPINPAIPPFEGPGLFRLLSASGSSTPTGTTSPTKRQCSDTLSPSLPHWERLGKVPRGYWSAHLHESKLSTQNTGPLSLSLEVTSYLDDFYFIHTACKPKAYGVK